MEILKLKPVFKDYLWGGTKLKTEYQKESDLAIIAESWELSAHPDGASIIENGKYQGKTFVEYLQSEGKAIWGEHAKHFKDFPILIKFIDAKQALSIQVHPDDEYALRVEHEYGKNEMWYIMGCDPGAYLYYGVNQELTKDALKQHIENDTVLDVLNKVEVKKGDCFFIEAGTIHAIGAGCLICEIQQNSNSTYRVYDFGRVGIDGKPRELHIDKAIDVSKLEPSERDKNKEQEEIINDKNSKKALTKNKYFTVDKYLVNKEIMLNADNKSFQSITILDGKATIKSASQTIQIKKGETIFVPSGYGEYNLTGACEFIVSSL